MYLKQIGSGLGTIIDVLIHLLFFHSVLDDQTLPLAKARRTGHPMWPRADPGGLEVYMGFMLLGGLEQP